MRIGRVFDQRLCLLAECVVLDISKHGVRIKIKGEVALPPQLIFLDERTGRIFNAEVRWRRDREIGLYIRAGIE